MKIITSILVGAEIGLNLSCSHAARCGSSKDLTLIPVRQVATQTSFARYAGLSFGFSILLLAINLKRDPPRELRGSCRVIHKSFPSR